MPRLKRAGWVLSGVALGFAVTSAQKPPLDHSVYDGWNSIRSTAVSRDGAWVAYIFTPQEGDTTGIISAVDGGRTIKLPRASKIDITKDSLHAVALVAPPFVDTRKARRAKAKPEDMPKNAFATVDLKTGTMRQVEAVQSYVLPEEDSGYVLYKPEPPKPAVKPVAPAKPTDEDSADAQRPAAAADAKPDARSDAKKTGEPYVLLNLASGNEDRLENVEAVAFDRAGDVLAYSTRSKDGETGTLFYDDLAAKKTTTVWTGAGHFPKLALSSDGRQLAFTTDKDDVKAKKPALSLYIWSTRNLGAAGHPARVGEDSIPKDWSINEGHTLEFSHDGTRLLYGTSPKPTPDPEPKPDDENVSVDVWNWKDERLQTQQLIEAKEERTRGYLAVYDVAQRRSLQVGDRSTPEPILANRGDGRYALISDPHPYPREGSWTGAERADLYVLNLATGVRATLAKRFLGEQVLSPSGAYVALFDGEAKTWTAVDLVNGRRTSLSAQIPTSVVDELDDHPDFAPPYGIVGWTSADGRAIVADRYDLWSCDPTGKTAPSRLTSGRRMNVRYRPIRLDREERFLNLADLPLDAFNEENKWDGVARLTARGVETLISAPKSFGGFVKAKNAGTLVFTRQDFVEFPDLWATKALDLAHATKITNANPQQAKYNWGTSELVSWTSLDGVPLQGILIRPENFTFGKKYPLIAYFYERDSDNLYRYSAPAPSASTINLPLFASKGYCIFIPDIPYKVGFPGESAVNAILPGIQSVVSRGYIDPKRIGIQGQSWGGYQVAFLVTRTNMFACAEAGAPVGDMFSAYGGIRYGSGVVREFQYEHGQSRIGGTPWDSTLKYVENSPVFWADKIQTPLMIMSNDKDGAVPHTQGIELFTALRRLDKPSWMVVYNEEDHNLVHRKDRKDLSIRLSQFFDHYLLGAPMPVWMSKGVPALEKGRTMGTELEK